MTKVNIRRLDSVTTNDTTATQLINENFEALQEAIENTISRDGTTPNFMDADLDLNSYKIINAGTPTNNTDVITKEYFDEYVGDAAGYAAAAESSANRAAIAAQAAQGYSTAASGAADVAQRARDFIESDPGFVAVSTDLLLGEDSSIKKTSDDLTNIDTVADNITNVNAVANNETNINAVNANKTNIDTVATNIADVSSVATDIAKVTAVADDLTNIDAVNANKTNIDAVAGNNTNITAVANNETNINAVNANKTNIDAVVANATNINTVAGDITNINAVAADLTNIDNASAYADEAKQWAIGDPTEPSAGSAKYWAGQAAAGQVQADWTEADTTSKAYIKNKPTVDASPTQYSTNLVQSGGVFTSVNSLQNQIDAIVASSDVFDIVGTYAELQAYDITTVPVNDIIKVLVDSTHDDAATYYRCTESGGVKSWTYVGAEGAYYTKGEADSKFSTITATGNSLDYTGDTLSLENSSGTVLSSVTIKSANDRNIGEIVQSTIPLTDASLHLLDGSLISGSGSYANFVTYIASLVAGHPDIFETEANWQQSVSDYGICGKFVYDSVNNTVRLPKISGFTEGTINPTTLGDLTQAGLPNITGTFATRPSSTTDQWGVICSTGGGAFANQQQVGSNVGVVNPSSSTSNKYDIVDFNASRSSSIYGNSTTVQPQSIKVLYYIVMATSIKTAIEVDIDEITTDLNGKADIDLTNVQDNIVDLLYPVGSVYIGTTANCPLSAIKGTWTLVSSGIVTAVDSNVPVKGTGKNLGLTNGTNSGTLTHVWGTNIQGAWLWKGGVGSNVGSATSSISSGNAFSSNITVGVVEDETKSGIVGTASSTTLSVNIWERTA